jgi:hypothetical protein
LLREYRDAVDYIRTTTETLQQLRKYQLQGRDKDELVSVLTADRIRRTNDLCLEVIADLDAGRVRPESKSLEELQRAIQQLQQHLRQGGKTQVAVRLNAASEE